MTDAKPATRDRALSASEVCERRLDLVDTSRSTAATDGFPGADRRVLSTLVHQPAVGNTRSPFPPWPIVVFSHGRAATPRTYTGLLRHWAAAGYVVAAPYHPLTHGDTPFPPVRDDDHQRALDLSFVTDELIRLSGAATTDALPGIVDGDRVCVAGHSLGGLAVIDSIWGSNRDARFQAAIVLANGETGVPSSADSAAARTPLLVAHGSDDPAIAHAVGRLIYERAEGPALLLTLRGGRHFQPFSDPASPHAAAVAQVTTDFLAAFVAGDREALVRLGDDPQGSPEATLETSRVGGQR